MSEELICRKCGTELDCVAGASAHWSNWYCPNCEGSHGHTPDVQACPSCNGNDRDRPCAYPSEGRPGCMRDERLSVQAKVTKRDGNWIDELGCCRVCDGEIPYGHTLDCDYYKLERRLVAAEADKQPQIDAALESAAQELRAAIASQDYPGAGNGLEIAEMIVCAHKGTNPLGERDARIAELEDLYYSMLDWRAKCDDLTAKLAQAQEVIDGQLRTIKSLMQGVEEHTGKEGTTPVLTYIARLESRVAELEASEIALNALQRFSTAKENDNG